MSEDEVLNIVIKVLEAVLAKHANTGRYEINRLDLTAALDEMKVLGLPAAKKS